MSKNRLKTLPPNVTRIHETNVDETMRHTNEDYDDGKLDGILVCRLLKDGTFTTEWGGGKKMGFLKAVGMAQTLVHDIIEAPNKDD